MGASYQIFNRLWVVKLPILLTVFILCSLVLAMPDAIARGGHGGGHQLGSGSHTSRHFGGHNHAGGQRHFGGGHRSFAGHGRFGGGYRHNHFGSRHRSSHFASQPRHRHFGSGHRRHLSGRTYYGGYRGYYSGYSSAYRRGYGYYPGNYGYVYSPGYYAPGSYAYSYPSYSLYKPGYYSAPPYVGEYRYSSKYTGTGRNYRYNSATARYPDNSAGSYSTSDLGWRLLAQNNPREALHVFADQARQRQTDGIPKVGYALSAALQGDLNKAAWAMRRAFRIDPDSLHYLKIDASLRASIDRLLIEYHDQLNHAQGNRHFDVAFMIAALNYLIHEQDAARIAIEQSVDKFGDHSPSAMNLQRLVANNGY